MDRVHDRAEPAPRQLRRADLAQPRPAAKGDDPLFAERGPESLFAAIGHMGQYVLVAPDRKLVVVRLGHSDGEQMGVLRGEMADVVELYPRQVEAPLDHRHARPAEPGAVAVQPAGEVAAARRGLVRGEAVARPSRAAQNGVSAAWAEPVTDILVDPAAGDEHPADHVGVVARRGADELVVAQRAEPARSRARGARTSSSLANR